MQSCLCGRSSVGVVEDSLNSCKDSATLRPIPVEDDWRGASGTMASDKSGDLRDNESSEEGEGGREMVILDDG